MTGLNIYPSDYDTWSTKVDNVNRIFADHVNKLQDVVEAIEYELGLGPKGATSNVAARLDTSHDIYGNNVDRFYNNSGRTLNIGEVVVADKTQAQSITVSGALYNEEVIGVVTEATAAGLLTPIATLGNVGTYVTAETGDISPGDWLTTASTPGYATKALADTQVFLGKANTTISAGTSGIYSIFVRVGASGLPEHTHSGITGSGGLLGDNVVDNRILDNTDDYTVHSLTVSGDLIVSNLGGDTLNITGNSYLGNDASDLTQISGNLYIAENTGIPVSNGAIYLGRAGGWTYYLRYNSAEGRFELNAPLYIGGLFSADYLQSYNDAIIWGNTSVNTISTSGNAEFGNDVVIHGDLYVEGTEYVTETEVLTGDQVITGSLYVSGNTYLGSDSTDTVYVSGDLAAAGTISASALNIADNSIFQSDLTIEGDLYVNGTEYITNTEIISGDQIIGDELWVKGNSYLGNELTDTTFVSGDLYVGGIVHGSSPLKIGDDLNMNSNKIASLGEPNDNSDATTKNYVDTLVAATSGQGGGGGASLITGVLGETIDIGQPAYQAESDSKWYLAQAIDGKLTSLSICQAGGNADDTGTFMRYGEITSATSVTSGKELYVSQDTPGELIDVVPETGIISFIGVGKENDKIDVAIGLTSYTINSTGGGGTGTGILTGTLGEAASAGQPVYQQESDGKWYLAQAVENMVSSLSIVKVGGGSGATASLVRYAEVTGLDNYPSNKELYLSQDSPGVLTDTVPACGIKIYTGITRGPDTMDVVIGVIGGSISGGSGGTGTGVTEGELGETVAKGQPVYQNSLDGKWYLAQGVSGKISSLSVCILGGSSGATGQFIRYGEITGLTGLPDSNEIYLSQENAGEFVETASPSGVVAYIGVSRGTTELDVAIGITSYASSASGNVEVQGQIYSPSVDHGDVSGAFDLNWNDGNVHTISLTDNATGNLIHAFNGASYVLTVTQGTSGNNLNFVQAIKWPGGETYVPTTTQGSVDVLNFIYANSTYYGAYMQDMS